MRPLPFLLAGRLVLAPLHQHMAARRGWVGVCGVFFSGSGDGLWRRRLESAPVRWRQSSRQPRVAQWTLNEQGWTAVGSRAAGRIATSHNADARLCFAAQTRDCPGTCWKGPESKRYLPRHYRHCVQRPFQPSTIAPLGAIRPFFFLLTVPAHIRTGIGGVARCTLHRSAQQMRTWCTWLRKAAPPRTWWCAAGPCRAHPCRARLSPPFPLRARRCQQEMD
jgi:hypothetical protein